MWLRLDLEGLDFRFRITRYHPSTRANWDCEWCRVDLSMIASNWLDYHIDNQEILLCTEVEQLKDSIADLLADRLTERKEVSFIEPDLAFFLQPREKIKWNPDITYIAPGDEWTEVDADLEVHTWNHGLTENRIVTCFGRDELEIVLCYLRIICGELTTEDDDVKKYMSEGIFYESCPVVAISGMTETQADTGPKEDM